jgi:hypothetical protein
MTERDLIDAIGAEYDKRSIAGVEPIPKDLAHTVASKWTQP